LLPVRVESRAREGRPELLALLLPRLRLRVACREPASELHVRSLRLVLALRRRIGERLTGRTDRRDGSSSASGASAAASPRSARAAPRATRGWCRRGGRGSS